jgi:hypothetical protein
MEPEGLKDRPEARNLVNIYAALSDRTVDWVLAEVGGHQFSQFKPRSRSSPWRSSRPSRPRWRG